MQYQPISIRSPHPQNRAGRPDCCLFICQIFYGRPLGTSVMWPAAASLTALLRHYLCDMSTDFWKVHATPTREGTYLGSIFSLALQLDS
jgi:hypothetical protein